MKYPAEAYAAAFLEAVEGGKKKEDAAIKKFLSIVRRNGDWGGISKIFKLIAGKIAREAGGRYVLVETGRTPTKKISEMLMESFSKEDHVEFRVKPELVAGARILMNGEREFDGTLVAKINKLFK